MIIWIKFELLRNSFIALNEQNKIDLSVINSVNQNLVQ